MGNDYLLELIREKRYSDIFDYAYNQYSEPIANYILRRLPEEVRKEEYEDLTSETFVVLLEELSSSCFNFEIGWSYDQRIRSYLFTVARNKLSRWYRDRSMHESHKDRIVRFTSNVSSRMVPDANEMLQCKDTCLQIESALSRMHINYSKIIRFYWDNDGLPSNEKIEEYRRENNLTIKAFKTCYLRARHSLIELLPWLKRHLRKPPE